MKERQTIEALRAALNLRVEREQLTDIAKNADVPYGWLQQMFYGNIVEPGLFKASRLAKYLGVKLES